MKRYAYIDLFLDTLYYSAGSTAIAALQGGCPVLTLNNSSNASRMGGSIVSAAGLDDLIFEESKDFIKKAVDLANNSDDLADLRKKLTTKTDLFDLEKFISHMESLFEEMIKT